MGTLAVSKKEEQQIERLRKELHIPTKAGVLRAALKTLEHQTTEERLRHEIHESVGGARTPTNENIGSSLRLPWAAGSRTHRCRSSPIMLHCLRGGMNEGFTTEACAHRESA